MAGQHQRRAVRVTHAALLLGGLLLSLFVLDLALGSVSIPPGAIVTILTGGEPENAAWSTIIMLFRLPKALTAILSGAALAVSGLLMQTLFRNPLAGPSVLGIHSGASLGVAAVVLSVSAGGVGADFLEGLGLVGELGIVLAAAMGSSVVLFLILAVSQRVRSVMTLLIVGLLFGYATSALVSILIHFSIADRVHAYMAWTFGSFSATTWSKLRILLPTLVVGLVGSLLARKPLNALLLGESYGRSMGVDVRRARHIIIVLTAVLSGTVTAFCGPIGFLGIAVPHLCRSLFHTSDHRVLLPGVMIIGAIAALAADLVSHVPGSGVVLPLNAVTSLIGAPVIVWVILRKKNMSATFAA